MCIGVINRMRCGNNVRLLRSVIDYGKEELLEIIGEVVGVE